MMGLSRGDMEKIWREVQIPLPPETEPEPEPEPYCGVYWIITTCLTGIAIGIWLGMVLWLILGEHR